MFFITSRHDKKAAKALRIEAHMISRLLLSLVFLAFVAASVGFAVLAVWDVPVAQTPVEKTLDNGRFLQKS
jgi:hypothetical protein